MEEPPIQLFKAIYTRPVPSDAEIVERDGVKGCVVKVRRGRAEQFARLSKDGQKILLETTKWYVAVRDREGKRKHVALSADAEAAREMARRYLRFGPKRLPRLNAADGVGKKTYFLFAKVDGATFIKISRTANVFRRYRTLQLANVASVTLVGYFPEDRESALHRKFADQHSHGDWFHGDATLIEWLRTNISDGSMKLVSIPNELA